MRWTIRTEAARQAMEARVREALVEAGKRAAEGANRRAPVGETGRLSRSYRYRVEGQTLRVGSDLEYAACVELGTDRVPARPHLGRAVEEAGEELGVRS